MRVHEGRQEALARKKRETLVAPDLGEIMRIGRGWGSGDGFGSLVSTTMLSLF